MKHKIIFGFLLTFLCFHTAIIGQDFFSVPGTVVVHSPKSTGIFRGTPSIAKIPNGNIIVSNDVFGEGVSNKTDIFISRDKGNTWEYKSTVTGAVWSGLFFHNNKLYLMGANTSGGSNFVIRCSEDQGSTWTTPVVLIPGACHGSSTPVLVANGRIYKAYEHHYVDVNEKWMSGNKSFIISAPANSDLMKASNWTVTDEIEKPAWVDGTGWLESNAVIGRDGKIKGISRLASMESIYAGYYSLESDSKIEEGSTRKIQFWGGASKFNIRYDAATDKYWSLTNYAPEVLKKGNRSAGGIRSVLALTSSTDLEEWEVNAIVLADMDVENVGFQYVDWIFDGNDILFVSRTAFDDGLGGANNYHDANFMTFHRIENYATATTPQEWVHLLPNDGWNGVVKGLDRSGGRGTSAENPIIINHPGQLVYLSEEVYKGNGFENTYFRMTNDIDLNEFNYLPIGWYMTTSNNRPFSGHFDGDGYIIKNLNINRNDDVYSSNAVFGYLKGGSVSNLGVSGNIYVGSTCGGIVAQSNAGVIQNCYSKVNIVASSHGGGIVGYGVSSPKINNCYNKGSVYLSSTSATNKYVGGIMGYFNTGVVSNCYNAGEITAAFTNTYNIGSVVGSSTSSPTNCYYLEGSTPNGGNGVGIRKTEEELRSSYIIELLINNQQSTCWKIDNDLVNEGFPILYWEQRQTSSGNGTSVSLLKAYHYFNPMESKSTISLSLEKAGYLTITAFDASGHLLDSIFQGNIQPGCHNFEYFLTHGSGIYFCEVVFNKVESQVLKMLVK